MCAKREEYGKSYPVHLVFSALYATFLSTSHTQGNFLRNFVRSSTKKLSNSDRAGLLNPKLKVMRDVQLESHKVRWKVFARNTMAPAAQSSFIVYVMHSEVSNTYNMSIPALLSLGHSMCRELE